MKRYRQARRIEDRIGWDDVLLAISGGGMIVLLVFLFLTLLILAGTP